MASVRWAAQWRNAGRMSWATCPARGDRAGPGQAAADGRGRDPHAVMVFQVPGDPLRSGVQASPGQLLTDPGHQADRFLLDRPRRGPRPPRPRLDCRLAFFPVAGQQRADPRTGRPVTAGYLANRALFHRDRHDDQPCSRHPGCLIAPAANPSCQAGRESNCPGCLEARHPRSPHVVSQDIGMTPTRIGCGVILVGACCGRSHTEGCAPKPDELD